MVGWACEWLARGVFGGFQGGFLGEKRRSLVKEVFGNDMCGSSYSYLGGLLFYRGIDFMPKRGVRRGDDGPRSEAWGETTEAESIDRLLVP